MWGSETLQKKMKTYEKELESFMERTTVHHLLDYLPGQVEPPDAIKLSKCTSRCKY